MPIPRRREHAFSSDLPKPDKRLTRRARAGAAPGERANGGTDEGAASDGQAAAPQLSGVVLAAGEGVRMRSAGPRPLHAVAGRAMLAHALGRAGRSRRGANRGRRRAGSATTSPPRRRQRRAGGGNLRPARARGTAHAVLAARAAIARGYDDILVTYADIPLISARDAEATARRRSPRARRWSRSASRPATRPATAG